MTVMDQPDAPVGRHWSKGANLLVRAASAILIMFVLALPTMQWVEPIRATKLFMTGAGLWMAGVAIKGAAYFLIGRSIGRTYADWQGTSGYLAHCFLSLNELLPYLAFVWVAADATNPAFLVEAAIVAYAGAAFETVLLLSLPPSWQIDDADIVDDQDRPLSKPRALAISAIERILATIIHVTARLGVAAGLLIGPLWVAAVCAGCFAVIEAEAIRLVKDGRCRFRRVIKYYCLVGVLSVVSVLAIAFTMPGANR